MRWIFGIYLLVLGMMDIRSRQIPIKALLPGMFLGMISALADLWGQWPALGIWAATKCQGLLPGALLLLVSWGTKKVGKADGFVFLLLGVAVEAKKCTMTFAFSLILAAGLGVILVLTAIPGRRNRWQYRIPYLPCIAVAYFLTEVF